MSLYALKKKKKKNQLSGCYHYYFVVCMHARWMKGKKKITSRTFSLYFYLTNWWVFTHIFVSPHPFLLHHPLTSNAAELYVSVWIAREGEKEQYSFRLNYAKVFILIYFSYRCFISPRNHIKFLYSHMTMMFFRRRRRCRWWWSVAWWVSVREFID